jgi:hypothetical protein
LSYCVYTHILLLYEHRGTLSEIWQSSSFSLAYIRIYIHTCVCMCIRASVSFCLCLSFLFFLSISIDAIAQNEGEKRGKERKFDDDDVYSMASCIYIEKKKKAQKSVWKKEIMHITSFFSSLLFYSLSCSLSLSSANCTYKQ